jgi:hypothetical protein
MARRTLYLLFIFVLSVSSTVVSVHAQRDSKSVVIGRLKGTWQELPGYFAHNPEFLSRSKDSVEFKGFRLRNLRTGKNFIIRPFKSGFYSQRLPEGEYEMLRVRRDKPGYREEKTINILYFSVPGASLVNLGTLRIVLQGAPHESLTWGQEWAKGTYTYRYGYERVTGIEAYDAPLHWYSEKNPEYSVDYEKRIILIENDPTELVDSSRLVIRDYPRWRPKSISK